MTASNFRTLVKNFTALKPEELSTLKDLSTQYPYSQVIQLLIARGSRDLGAADQQHHLHRAAIYATDRSLVKWAMTSARKNRMTAPAVLPEVAPKPSPAVEVKAPPVAAKVAPVIGKVPAPVPAANTKPAQALKPVALEGDALIADLAKELSRLQQLKHNFDDAYAALHTPGAPIKMPAKSPAVAKEVPAKPSAPGVESAGQEAPLIEEIKATRKKLKVPSPKVAEQGEIIDNFIKVAPTLPKAKATQPSTDLAEESVNYTDNIISETLVEILLKQGKKAKAIEMLKKLIWKFPQKKAYFAAQIEALKN